jgi:uncharacterized protein (TIGR03437 family)
VPGTKADLVIGQPDIFRSIPNYPNGPAGPPTDSSLLNPVGVAVDANGNLYVADFGNSRILRFPSPFTQPAGLQHANLVLGQSSFSSTLTDPSAQNMAGPWGLVFLSDGSLVASDAAHNRVLVFKKPSQGDFTTFQRASNVIGQNDFNSRLSGNGNAQLNNPRHMGVDTSDRLYVADSINGRVQIFALGNAVPQTGLAAALTIPGLSTPQAVTVSPITGEAFIANTNAGVVLRVPEFTQLLLSAGIAVTAQIVTNGPLDVALDANDNLVVAEAINRVTFFFAKLGFQHAATYNNLGVAPGQLLLLNRQGKDFSLSDGLIDGSNQSPWPANLGDIQVTVNGMLSPIFHIIPGRIDMQVPQNAPSTGTADFLVTRVSTGEILGAASIPMVPYNPGFFTLNASGFGQLAATDQTGKVNGPATSTTSPIKAGTYITLYGTGLGVVPNAPPDGVSPSGAIPAPNNTQVLINGPSFMDLSKDGNAYSGLGAFPGGWQINVKVPSDVACGGGGSTAVCTAIPVVVLYNQNYTSNIGLDGRRLTTTITTTQQSQ